MCNLNTLMLFWQDSKADPLSGVRGQGSQAGSLEATYF